MTDQTLTLAAAETALCNLPSTKTLGNETISLHTALDALRGVAGEAWQPIETAQDDTKVLVLFQEPFFGLPTPEIETAYFDSDDGEWKLWVSQEKIGGRIPAHWMPLPEPPTTYRQKRGQNYE